MQVVGAPPLWFALARGTRNGYPLRVGLLVQGHLRMEAAATVTVAPDGKAKGPRGTRYVYPLRRPPLAGVSGLKVE